MKVREMYCCLHQQRFNAITIDDDAYTVQPVGHFYRALKYRKDTMKDIEVLALKGEDYMRRIYNHKLILKDVATKKIGISVCMKRGTYHTISGP